MSKKKLFSLAVIAIMVAILSMSSLAWFTDSDSVTNQFMIADSDDTNPDDIFSVDVWEKTPELPEGEKDQDGYEYKNILPGDVLEKEVIVENTGYYDQYIRVTVTVSDAAAWKAIIGENYGIWDLRNIVEVTDTYATDWYSNGDLINYDATANTITYTMYCRNILKAGDTVTVFEAVNIPASMTVEQAALFETNFTITVKAEAVQTENLGVDTTDDIVDAVEAFAAVEKTQTNG